jgi:mannose/fructose/sorbose-specific phosphotransferase system IIA component
MINIVVVSHADLGDALFRAAEMIVGATEGLYSVSLLPEDRPEGFGEKLEAALRPIEGEETLILVDLFGGTPYNVAARQVLKENVECVTGANLPMLLELIMSRDDGSLSDLAEEITRAGQESVKNLGPMLHR